MDIIRISTDVSELRIKTLGHNISSSDDHLFGKQWRNILAKLQNIVGQVDFSNIFSFTMLKHFTDSKTLVVISSIQMYQLHSLIQISSM